MFRFFHRVHLFSLGGKKKKIEDSKPNGWSWWRETANHVLNVIGG